MLLNIAGAGEKFFFLWMFSSLVVSLGLLALLVFLCSKVFKIIGEKKMDNPFPNQQHFCQSCGMPLTEEVTSDNPEYCTYCYKDGHFTQECTMEQMVDFCVQYVDEFNKNTGHHLTADEYRRELLQYFPTLKRWQK